MSLLTAQLHAKLDKNWDSEAAGRRCMLKFQNSMAAQVSLDNYKALPRVLGQKQLFLTYSYFSRANAFERLIDRWIMQSMIFPEAHFNVLVNLSCNLRQSSSNVHDRYNGHFS